MVDLNKAEFLAEKVIQDYVNQCKCTQVADVGNVLLEIIVFCGRTIDLTLGKGAGSQALEEAAKRLKTERGIQVRTEAVRSAQKY